MDARDERLAGILSQIPRRVKGDGLAYSTAAGDATILVERAVVNGRIGLTKTETGTAGNEDNAS